MDKMKQDIQNFRKEIEDMAQQHCHAFSGVQLMNLFGQKRFKSVKDPLNPKERARLEYMLLNEIT